PDRVLGLLMPENDSSSDSERLGQVLADHYGVEAILENIGPVLDAAGCYRRRDEAVQSVIPEFAHSDKFKIVLPNLWEGGLYRIHYVVAELADGRQIRARLPLDAYQTI